ncbi:hypothetical protein CUC15_04715 [Oceanobacillus zhaokaii]|uniref:Uncharacterized protein n=1 Tax=Oceanobacillus zhaokaii TaxID=2052660 RepID=A0A345PE48_9BACI|nr:hypothetical protein CUC15_04715 [Oceanobacillus zhaokaii]
MAIFCEIPKDISNSFVFTYSTKNLLFKFSDFKLNSKLYYLTTTVNRLLSKSTKLIHKTLFLMIF